MVALDVRLSPLIKWPDREHLWRTMPQCFQVSFGQKTTVIIDCFEIFICRPGPRHSLRISITILSKYLLALLLRRQARYCNFGDSLDDNLRDQLIEKLPDIELKKKLLETRNITLAQVLEKTRASQAPGQQVKHMAGVSDVNAVGRKEDETNDQSAKTCFSCRKAGHFSRDPSCPAKGRKCSSCSMYGHFAVCCRNLDRTAPETGRGFRPKNNSGNPKAFRRQTNQVEDNVADSSQEEENPAFAFTVMEENEEGVCQVSTPRHVPTMNVSIDGMVQELLIDAGSVSNLMGEDDFQN